MGTGIDGKEQGRGRLRGSIARKSASSFDTADVGTRKMVRLTILNSLKRTAVAVTVATSTALIGAGAIPVVLPETAIQAEADERDDWRYEVDRDETTLLGLSRTGDPQPPTTPTDPGTPPATRENVYPLVKGSGTVNCAPGEACIDPETGMAHVEYKVQFAGPSLSSPDNDQISGRGGEVAIPKVLENVQVRLETFYPDDPAERGQEVVNVGANLPVYVDDASDLDGYLSENEYGVNLRRTKIENNTDYSLRHTPVTLSSFADAMEKRQVGEIGNSVTMHESGPDEHPYRLEDRSETFYRTKNAELYNFLTISPTPAGLYTYTISGDVKVESDVEEIYLPIKAEQKGWKCSWEGEGVGSREEGCVNLKWFHGWALTGDLPFYDLNDSAVNQDLANRSTRDGLGGNPFCAVTKNFGRFDRIGEDTEPRDLARHFLFSYWLNPGYAEDGIVFDRPYDGPGVYEAVSGYGDPVYSAAEMYARTFTLDQNLDTTYILSGDGVNEDWCDQAAVKLVWCSKEEPMPTTVTNIETIVTMTRETETETVTETPPVTTVTETPKTEAMMATTTESATTTVTETPTTETVTETLERDTVTETPKPETVTPEKETMTETKTSTMAETPKQVTETTTLPQKTVTEQVPTTVVENKTKTVKLPPVTVTETKKQETVTVTETPRDNNPAIIATFDTYVEEAPIQEETSEDVTVAESIPQPPVAKPPRILASTGASIAGFVGIAGLLIGVAVFVTRRRK